MLHLLSLLLGLAWLGLDVCGGLWVVSWARRRWRQRADPAFPCCRAAESYAGTSCRHGAPAPDGFGFPGTSSSDLAASTYVAYAAGDLGRAGAHRAES